MLLHAVLLCQSFYHGGSPAQTPSPPTPFPTPSPTPLQTTTSTSEASLTSTPLPTAGASVTSTGAPPVVTNEQDEDLSLTTPAAASATNAGCLPPHSTLTGINGVYNINNHVLPYYVAANTYTFDVPSAHPLQLRSSNNNCVALHSQKFGGSIDNHFWGQVTITIPSSCPDFATWDLHCYHHGFMNGENRLIQHSNCKTVMQNSLSQTNSTSSTCNSACVGGIVGGIFIFLLILTLLACGAFSKKNKSAVLTADPADSQQKNIGLAWRPVLDSL